MKKIVLDTSVLIDFLRQPKKETLFQRLFERKDYKLLLPAVVLTELYVGKSAVKASGEKKLKGILKKTKLVLADGEISKQAGILMQKHSDFYLADALIAATALKEKATLCTFNRAHFRGILGLSLFEF